MTQAMLILTLFITHFAAFTVGLVVSAKGSRVGRPTWDSLMLYFFFATAVLGLVAVITSEGP